MCGAIPSTPQRVSIACCLIKQCIRILDDVALNSNAGTTLPLIYLLIVEHITTLKQGEEFR